MKNAKIETLCDARAFALGGRATFTVVSGKTGNRFTYQVCKARPRDGEPEDAPTPWFVKFLRGPDNTSDYQYLGMVRPDGGSFTLTAASKAGEDAPVCRAWSWVWSALSGEHPERFGSIEFWHAGRCGRCNRHLTTPESLARGLGPICAGIA